MFEPNSWIADLDLKKFFHQIPCLLADVPSAMSSCAAAASCLRPRHRVPRWSPCCPANLELPLKAGSRTLRVDHYPLPYRRPLLGSAHLQRVPGGIQNRRRSIRILRSGDLHRESALVSIAGACGPPKRNRHDIAPNLLAGAPPEAPSNLTASLLATIEAGETVNPREIATIVGIVNSCRRSA